VNGGKNVANHPQAKKRNRQRIKRTVRGRRIRTTMRTAVKQLRALIAEDNTEASKDALKAAIKLLDKSVTQGILRRKTASRTISRLTVAVNKSA
jgi:small subunit ribosomal protein S20